MFNLKKSIKLFMFNLKKQQNVGIYNLNDAVAVLHDVSGMLAVQGVDMQKHFTKNAFLFVTEGKKKQKTAKTATAKTTHQACTTSLANSGGAISRHLGKSINIYHQHKCNCIPTFHVSGKICMAIQGRKRTLKAFVRQYI